MGKLGSVKSLKGGKSDLKVTEVREATRLVQSWSPHGSRRADFQDFRALNGFPSAERHEREFRNNTNQLFSDIYNSEIIEEEAFITWSEDLESVTKVKSRAILAARKFLGWLRAQECGPDQDTAEESLERIFRIRSPCRPLNVNGIVRDKGIEGQAFTLTAKQSGSRYIEIYTIIR